jgi:predicted RND superfamily exporter protein
MAESVKPMVSNKRDHGSEKILDGLGSAIVRASAPNEDVAEAAATSPFLYTRLRSRIESERKRREEGEGWLAMLGVIWRTVPAMALVAVFAMVLFLSTGSNSLGSGNTNYEVLLGDRDTAEEQVVFADKQFTTSDEVLDTILSEDEQGASK